jgi:hypothetical protein
MAKFADIDEKGKKVTDAGDDTATYPLPEAIGGREWGPFRNLENVVTEFGEYGVERGKVLYFVWGHFFNADNQRVEAPMPAYREATQAEQAMADKLWFEMMEKAAEVRR